ncbi:hypothetical protein R5H32_20540 [Defluviimonas sp. D31]|uniref:hypothetical protein n=1 Tax=Defluviimonas sp. D31 TaxID=3083253 RepID=UPI00296E710B|nr:hypothetical protein [Defluviimonas sp. D31]MDW4551717.1 hypothetical protein [Defluviimonas sp. D31]
MGLKRLSKKISCYKERFEQGRADEIKPDHVIKVLSKLKAKKAALAEEIAAARTDDKLQRLERKLKIANEHITRAEWLLREFTDKPVREEAK